MIERSRNIAIMCLGLGVAIVGIIFSESGHLLRHGVSIALGAFFAIKGTSKLRCELSDVAIAFAAFTLVLLSKVFPPRILPPDSFEIAALGLAVAFAVTGLKFKSIAAEQKISRNRTDSR